MTERDLLLQQLAEHRQLIWMAMIVFLAMLAKELFFLAAAIRKSLGWRTNGNPTDSLMKGQFDKGMATARSQANTRTMWAVAQVNGRIDQRLNAVDKQLKLARRKDNIMLIILRDIRAFMIYGRKPASDLPPIELDEDDTPAGETPDPTFPEEIDKTEEDREQP